jgi:predicted secreted protein
MIRVLRAPWRELYCYHMDSSMLKFALVALAVVFAAWPKNEGKQMISLAGTDSGKILTIAKGQAFTLTLPGHQGGGYHFDKVQYDSTILKLQSHTDNPPPAGSSPGKPGAGIWHFTALKRGQTPLKVTESRPWTKTGVIIEFENTVIVK